MCVADGSHWARASELPIRNTATIAALNKTSARDFQVIISALLSHRAGLSPLYGLEKDEINTFESQTNISDKTSSKIVHSGEPWP
jgi:hypothetical protein